MSELQVRGVGVLVDLYRKEVWQPFVDAGLPAAQWRSIAEKSVGCANSCSGSADRRSVKPPTS